MTYRLFNQWRGPSALSVRVCILIIGVTGLTLLSGFSCGQGNNVPPSAGTGAAGFNVGLGFGPDPSFDSQMHGDVNDPCQYYTAGVYKIKKITVEVFKYNPNGSPLAIYDPVMMKDGVNFLNGNPRSSVGPGVKFKIPEHGAFKIRVRMWGYDCDDLAPSEHCLDCCDDESEGPYWEDESGWQDNDKNKYAYIYVTYPRFIGCF